MQNETILQLDDIRVALDGAPLFEGVSLRLNKGDKVTLKGPSGSGKSTLLKCIVGFVASAGTIQINGERLNAHTVWRLRQHVAYVAQEPDLGEGTVQNALQAPFQYRANHTLTFDQHETAALFEAFLLPAHLYDKPLSSLSGGEKQRVALVAALLLRRPLLLLDEAAAALDERAKRRVKEHLVSKTDLTILSVSHDIRDFVFSDAILDMDDLKRGEIA